MIALKVAARRAHGARLLTRACRHGRNCSNRITSCARKFSSTTTIWTLLTFLDSLSAYFECDNGSHDTDRATTNGRHNFINCRTNCDTFERVKKRIACPYRRWVCYHFWYSSTYTNVPGTPAQSGLPNCFCYWIRKRK